MRDGPPPYVKLARKAFDKDAGDRFWLEPRSFSKWEAWVDVIQLACFAPYRHATALGVVDLERGEFVASRRFLAGRWRWTEKRVRIWLATCEKGSRLRAQRETAAGTVYLIVKYDEYQSSGPSKGPVKGPPKGHAGAQQGPKREEVKQELLSTMSDSTDVVMAHYLAVHPRRRPSDAGKAMIRRALEKGYTAAELCEAIDGNANDPWHQEKRKHELSYVLRNEEKIDGFRLNAEPVQPIVDEHGCLTPYGERLTRPDRD